MIGSTLLTVNGKTEMMDQTPVIKSGRTYLPARWVANALGYQVDWDAHIQDVLIWPNGTQEPPFGLTNLRILNTYICKMNILIGYGLTTIYYGILRNRKLLRVSVQY